VVRGDSFLHKRPVAAAATTNREKAVLQNPGEAFGDQREPADLEFFWGVREDLFFFKKKGTPGAFHKEELL
jgi:hypothetical protein